VHRAVRFHRPAIVLIRRPADAILSYLIRRPTITAVDAAREYLHFYHATWPLRERVVIAPFETVITDFGTVLSAVNRRYGTSYRRYEHTPENEEAAAAIVRQMNREELGGELRPSHGGMPSAERDRRKSALAGVIEQPPVARWIDRASDVHTAYLDYARAHQGTTVDT
jgi:hypothetical protein